VSTTMLGAALKYASRGKPVFPLHNVRDGRCSCGKDCGNNLGKHPRIPGGFKSATIKEEQIREWWIQWLDANIGMPTGEPSGFIVLDIDPRHGGQDSLAQLQIQHGPLPDTMRQITGSGGFHLLFAQPMGVTIHNSTALAGYEGVDVRGEGGYIVVAPSLHHSGNRYHWDKASPHTPAELPQWLLELMTSKRERDNSRSNQKARLDMSGILAGVPEGRRNESLFRGACKLRNADVPLEFAERLILEAAAKCKPPFAEFEAREIVARVYQTYKTREERRFESVAEVPSLGSIPDVPVEYLVDGFIPKSSVTVIAGAPGSLKSFLALDLSRCLAAGVLPLNAKSSISTERIQLQLFGSAH
jgi:putative DNA primase/helicase